MVVHVVQFLWVLFDILVEAKEWHCQVSLLLDSANDLIHSVVESNLEGGAAVGNMLKARVMTTVGNGATLAASNSVLMDAPQVRDSVFNALVVRVLEEQGWGNSPEGNVLNL